MSALPPSPPSTFLRAALIAADVLLALLLMAIGWFANRAGLFFNAVYLLIFVMLSISVGMTVIRLARGKLELGLWRTPLARELRPYRWQVLNGWVFWLLAGWLLETCIVPMQFPASQYAIMRALYWAGIAALMLLQLLPGKKIYWATNLAFTVGSVFMISQMARIHWPVRKSEGVVLSAPFRGEWLVLHGGFSALINHHYDVISQRDALDIQRVADGHVQYVSDQSLTNCASWGQILYAPADGKITEVVTNLDDNRIGQTDAENPAGNHLVIDIGSGHFVVMAHLQKGSIKVNLGDQVRDGQPIAKCGNSGNTSGPHLHIQVQNRPKFQYDNVKTFPILFRDITCLRGGHPLGDPPFFVRRNDRIVTSASADSAGSTR